MKRALLLLLVSAPALADTVDPIAEAKELYAEGKRYYDIADYPHAIESWKKAYMLSSAPMLLFNLGQAYRLSGDCPNALRMYDSYEHAVPDAPDHDDLVQARDRCNREPSKAHDPDPAQPPATVALPPTTTAPRVRDEDHGFGLRMAGIGVGAAGVGCGIAAIFVGGHAHDLSNQVGAYHGEWGAAQQQLQHDGKTARAETIGLSVASPIAILAGAALYVVGQRAAHTHVDIAISPTHTEVTWSLAF
ncbi:MAG TPA: hypothetical protein VGM88_28160 [Kofleriaceae bacterium]|jgi:tetratricopeptide (TPR) repeat protein